MAFTISHFQPCVSIVASAATSGSRPKPKPKPKPRPTRTFSLQSGKSQPSISDIERAIGVAPDPLANSPSNINTSVMELLESSPIGQEGDGERALREAAEKFTGHAEAHTASAHRVFLKLSLAILPLWLFALAVASGLIKLPFNVIM